MKLGTVIKLDNKNTATQKIGNNVMLVNCDVPITFPSFGQFRAIGKPDSGCMVCKTYFLLIATFFLQKLKTELKTSTTALILLL